MESFALAPGERLTALWLWSGPSGAGVPNYRAGAIRLSTSLVRSPTPAGPPTLAGPQGRPGGRDRRAVATQNCVVVAEACLVAGPAGDWPHMCLRPSGAARPPAALATCARPPRARALQAARGQAAGSLLRRRLQALRASAGRACWPAACAAASRGRPAVTRHATLQGPRAPCDARESTRCTTAWPWLSARPAGGVLSTSGAPPAGAHQGLRQQQGPRQPGHRGRGQRHPVRRGGQVRQRRGRDRHRLPAAAGRRGARRRRLRGPADLAGAPRRAADAARLLCFPGSCLGEHGSHTQQCTSWTCGRTGAASLLQGVHVPGILMLTW